MSDIEKVKQLRKSTGAGFKDCNAALKESNGDLDKAAEILRVKGIAKASKKMSRSATEGVVVTSGDEKKMSLIEVNCETDFVAKNEDFIEFVKELSELNNKYEYIVKDQDFRIEVLINNSGNYIELKNGYTYFEEANQDSETGTVVLVHGFSVPSYIMETTFNSIEEKGFRVIMMDLYGRGFSDNPDLPQTDELRANQVIELLDKRNIKKVSLVGLSCLLYTSDAADE